MTLPRTRALVLAAEGDVEGALAALDELDLDAAAQLPFDLGWTLLVRGRLHRRARQRRAAADALQEALEIFERLGAPAWAEQARAELDARRAAPRHRRADRDRAAASPSSPPSGLTNREVAAQAFMSPKTVEANLARVYRKLGIRSRAELGRARMATHDRERRPRSANVGKRPIVSRAAPAYRRAHGTIEQQRSDRRTSSSTTGPASRSRSSERGRAAGARRRGRDGRARARRFATCAPRSSPRTSRSSACSRRPTEELVRETYARAGIPFERLSAVIPEGDDGWAADVHEHRRRRDEQKVAARLIALVVATTVVGPQLRPGARGLRDRQQLAGTWIVTVNRPAPAAAADLAAGLHVGRQRHRDRQRGVREPHRVYGSWERIDGRLYAASAQIFRFNAATGAHVATMKIDRNILCRRTATRSRTRRGRRSTTWTGT